MGQSPSLIRLLKDCDIGQRQVIESEYRQLLVMAGAGAGKTRVLTYRIYHQIETDLIKPDHVLAITFTRKAATNLKERLANFGVPSTVTAGTFHAVALSALKHYYKEKGKKPPVVLPVKSSLLAAIIRENPRVNLQAANRLLSYQKKTYGQKTQIPSFHSDTQYLNALSNEIDWISSKLLTPDNYQEGLIKERRRPFIPEEIGEEVLRLYIAEKKKRSLLDFDDLIIALTNLIHTDYRYGSVLRWQYQHVFVDEVQDINLAQLRLLEAILGKNGNLFAVGDARQSIYSWNGAIQNIKETLSASFGDLKVLNLSTNYRSTPQIIEVASSLLEKGHKVSFVREQGTLPVLKCCESDIEEADFIAKKIRSLKFKVNGYHNIAVLARTNAQCEILKESLRAHNISAQNNLPPSVSLMGTIAKNFPDTPAGFQMMLGDMEMFLKETAGSDGGESLRQDGYSSLLPSFSSLGEKEKKDTILSLETFYGLGKEYMAFETFPDVSGFLYWLSLTQKADVMETKRDGVQVLTFHRAKGLEWQTVFVAGLEEGLVPIYGATSEVDLAEERRLLYVALSRATDELYLSWAKNRRTKNQIVPRTKSRWLEDIEHVIAAQADSEYVPADKVREMIEKSKMFLSK